MNEKIIQIIPAPKDLYAVYNIDINEGQSRILCLGLTNEGNVLILANSFGGDVRDVASKVNFVYLKWNDALDTVPFTPDEIY